MALTNLVLNQLFFREGEELLNFFEGLCVDLKGNEGLVAKSVVISANGGQVCASLLSPRLGLTSQPPTGTLETPPLCTTSTPWGQMNTCQLSGLSARLSRTMTRKQHAPLPPPCFVDVFLTSWGLMGCRYLDFPAASPGLNNTLILKTSLENLSIYIGMQEEDRVRTRLLLSPHHCC